MSYDHARHSVPEDFLAVCQRYGVADATIVAHLDSDEFYKALEDTSQHAAIAQQLSQTQKHSATDIHGVLAMYDVPPQQLNALLDAGLTAENAKRYAGRSVSPSSLAKTFRHNLDLGVLDDLIDHTKMPFENMAVLMANRIPSDWLRNNSVIPGRHRPGAPYRVFCEWVWQTSNSDLPEEYLDEMFLGAL